jgi:hypothetical protein
MAIEGDDSKAFFMPCAMAVMATLSFFSALLIDAFFPLAISAFWVVLIGIWVCVLPVIDLMVMSISWVSFYL